MAVTKIKSYDLDIDGTPGQILYIDGAGAVSTIDHNPFDQTLNVGDSVQFTGMTVTNLIAGGLTYPTIDGSANQVLKTDGAGLLSFVDAALVPAGNNGNIVFLDSGAFTTTNILNFDTSISQLNITGNIELSGNINAGGFSIGTAFTVDGAGTVHTADGIDCYLLTATTSVSCASLTVGTVTYAATDGTAGQILSTDGLGTISFVDHNLFDQTLNTSDTPGFTGLSIGPLSYPNTDGTNGSVITTDGAGILTLAPVSDIADGTYVLGLGATTDGTITFVNGRITAIQECT